MPKGKKIKSKKEASSRGVRKHLRELERQLTDAARQEVKRVRKLEKSRNRRQELQAAVEQLRIEAGVVTASTARKSKAEPRPAAKPAAAAATPAAAMPAAAAKPATANAAKPAVRTPRSAAAKPAAPKPVAPADKP